MSRKSEILLIAGALAVVAAAIAATASGQSSGAAAASASVHAPESEPRHDVTVTANRAQLQARVAKYVDAITVRENDEGLPRWQDPVCPLITGLPQQEGEFILGRISEIANAAKVPLAAEHCRPNLFIFVTAHPTQLLKGMEQKNRYVTFGNATPSVVDEFIATPRPVGVWYNTSMRTPEGTAPKQGLPHAAQVVGGSGLAGAPIFNDTDRTSHILLSKIWSFTYVYIVVDQARLQGVSRSQFADYVAMVGLADIRADAHPGDARTILALFGGVPQAAPDGLTDWDQSFLKSLYALEQTSKMQRGDVANSIVRDISSPAAAP